MVMTGSPAETRVLIVDDNPAIHDDIRRILRVDASEFEHDAIEAELFGAPAPVERGMPGLRIDSAFQGRGGLDCVLASLAASDPYAVAIVDGRMPPGWDGIETIGRIWEVYPQTSDNLLYGLFRLFMA